MLTELSRTIFDVEELKMVFILVLTLSINQSPRTSNLPKNICYSTRASWNSSDFLTHGHLKLGHATPFLNTCSREKIWNFKLTVSTRVNGYSFEKKFCRENNFGTKIFLGKSSFRVNFFRKHFLRKQVLRRDFSEFDQNLILNLSKNYFQQPFFEQRFLLNKQFWAKNTTKNFVGQTVLEQNFFQQKFFWTNKFWEKFFFLHFEQIFCFKIFFGKNLFD